MTDRRNYWTPDHRYLLFWAAGRVNAWRRERGLPTMDPWDLATEGWLRMLRRCKGREDLRPTSGNLLREMMSYCKRMDANKGMSLNEHMGVPAPGDETARIDALDALTSVCRTEEDEAGLKAAFEISVRGLGRAESKRRMGVTYERVRQRKNKFLKTARDRLAACA